MEGQIRVAIVDDSEAIRELLQMELQLDGRFHVVGTANDGWDGVQLVASERPDAVILDLEMPRMDGLNALRQIFLTSPDTKVLVFTGLDDVREYMVLSCGAHAMQPKSEPLSGVINTLASICD